MSKWKDVDVAIVHIATNQSFTYGLGDDGKVYSWNYEQGAWLKHWADQDNPR